MEQQFDSWQRGVRRVSLRVFAGFAVALALLQTRSLVLGVGEDARSVAVTALEVGCLLSGAVRGWRGLLNGMDAALFTLLLVVAAATSSAMRDPASTGGDGNPAFFFLAATLMVYVVVVAGAAAPVAVVGVAGLYAASSVVLGNRMLGPAVDEAVLLASSQIAIWLVLRQLVREAIRADHAHHRAITEQRVAARRTAEQRTALAARRTLHDRVLTSLLLLLHPDQDRLHIVRKECRDGAAAVRALAAPSGLAAAPMTTDEDLYSRIEAEAATAAETTGVVARVRHRPALRTLPIPGPVGDAMSGAVAEALRNVGRHAGVTDADVLITASGGGAMLVEVVDHGRGLPAGSPTGFGLRHSVSTRLREIGGSARIEASAEGGTHISLEWAPQEARDPAATSSPATMALEPELTRIPTHPQAFAVAFSAALLAGSLYLAVRYPFASTSAWADVAVFGGVLAYLICCIVAIPSPEVLRRTHQAGFVVLPGLLAAGLYLGGAGSLRGFEGWVVGLAGLPVLLLAMARPAAPVLALALLESAVVAAAAVLDPLVTPVDVLAPITQTPMFAALMVWGVLAIRRVRSTAVLDEDAASAASALTQTLEVRQRAIETHVAWLDSDVRAFLDAVGDGDLDPTDPAVQQRASVLALAVRDELALPAHLGPSLRQLIATTRSHGIRVRVRAGEDGSAGSEHPQLVKLFELLAGSDEIAEVTVSLPQEASPQLRVVVRPRLSRVTYAAVVAHFGADLLEIDEDDLVTIMTLEPPNQDWT